MKVKIVVLKAGPTNSFSPWGGDSGGVGPGANVKAGDEFVVEGASVSLSGYDGVGRIEIATADTPPPGGGA